MPTSEPGVPTGQEYGERKRFVGAARALGTSTGLPAGGGSEASPPSRPQQPGVVPPNFDVFENREPSDLDTPTAPVSQAEMRRQLLLSHPNPLYRDLAERILR